jgi:hypothetical protein
VQKSFRNGKDVADSISKMEKIDISTKIPVRKISGASKADDEATEQEGYDILYKAEIDMHTKRKHELEDNMNKTYSLIYRLQHCNKTIQDRIHAHPDFETKIENDPIELLKAIDILINDLERARYPYTSVTEAMTRFMKCRQLEKKPLADYVKRFKGNQDSMAQNMGKVFLKDFVKSMKQYADETNTETRRDAERIVCAMDSIYADEEQQPRQIWIADDKSDNSVLNGHLSVPNGHNGNS